MSEIRALKTRGYEVKEIVAKTDFSPEYIHAICFLLENGAERCRIKDRRPLRRAS